MLSAGRFESSAMQSPSTTCTDGEGAKLTRGTRRGAPRRDPSLLLGGAQILSGSGQPQVQAPQTARRTSTPQDETGRFVNKVLGSTDARWKEVFAKEGRTYRPPVLVLYRGMTEARCGGRAQ